MKYAKIYFPMICLLFLSTNLFSQAADRWQQKVEYDMDIDFDVTKHQFTGTQKIVYYNNSPDVLNEVFYHLYMNAFQPGSMMDVRNKYLPDSSPKIADKIGSLSPNETGYLKIKSLKQDGKELSFEEVGTILEVQLKDGLKPNKKTTLEMVFEGQVPIQIRRNGRHSAEGIDYSMSQWYPKLCEYDYQGWHANPYVGREFHGVWGDFGVSINIDKSYVIGATGYLQDADDLAKRTKDGKTMWRFIAPNVHDFVWGGDPDYTHTTLQAKDGPMMHFYFQKNDVTEATWAALPAIMDEAFTFINKTYGKYPYDKYSFIQGGDGGMEYPMATLITGERSLGSLVGVSVHELMHSWYQMILGTNEALYAWMDEGFTSYASDVVMNHLRSKGMIGNDTPKENPFAGTYTGYGNFTKSGVEEPLSVHADHFETNAAYGVGSYVKGSIFLNQLEYIVGKKAFDAGMLRYYDTWKFKHPNPNDFIRIMEKESRMELDWYKEYWVNTLHTIDYGIKNVEEGEKKTSVITLEKIGVMPMPIDVVVTDTKGNETMYTIPLRIMRGEKKADKAGMTMEVAADWPWTNPTYTLTVPMKFKKIAKVEIDPSHRIMDIETGNNTVEVQKN